MKISKDMDNKLKVKVMSKVKDASGGAGGITAADLSNMGDMVKDMNMREMKSLNATAVRKEIFF